MKNIFNATASWAKMDVFLKAAEEGDNAGVREFLDTHRNAISKRGISGWTAVKKAASAGKKDTVELLLENGAALTEALMGAARGGHNDIIELLLERGAYINEKEFTGWTALMMAAWYGQPDTAEFLLERGADMALTSKSGEIALVYAHRNHQPETAAVLEGWPDREARALAAAVAEFSPALKRDLPALRPFKVPRRRSNS